MGLLDVWRLNILGLDLVILPIGSRMGIEVRFMISWLWEIRSWLNELEGWLIYLVKAVRLVVLWFCIG